MSAPMPGSLVLFLASDPALARELAVRPATLSSVGRFFLPTSLLLHYAKRPDRPSDEPGPFPPEQVMCAQETIDASKPLGRVVKIVDVNAPGDDRPLVERFVRPSDVLPILLRSDGQRLEGVEAFTAKRLRQFLSKP